MTTILNMTASRFTVGISPRGYVLLEQRGLVSREVRGPEPTPGDMRFLAAQLNGCDGPRRDAFLREHGCVPIDHLIAATPFKGVIA